MRFLAPVLILILPLAGTVHVATGQELAPSRGFVRDEQGWMPDVAARLADLRRSSAAARAEAERAVAGERQWWRQRAPRLEEEQQ